MGANCGTCQANSSHASEIIAPQQPKQKSCHPQSEHPDEENSFRKTIKKTGENITFAAPAGSHSAKDAQSQIEAAPGVLDSQGTQTSLSLIQGYLNQVYERTAERSPTVKSNSSSQSRELASEQPRRQQDKKQRLAKSVSGDKLKFHRDSFVRMIKENVNTKYCFHTKLGEGAYGCVFRCTDKSNKQERAIKVIRKKAVKDPQSLFAELEVLRTLDHPNIIKLFEVFDHNDFYYVVTEYCGGGELFEFVRTTNRITERTIAMIMKQIFSAVKYMHEKNIVHRDLKPENIVLEQNDLKGSRLNCPPIKIIDFGTATHFSADKFLVQKVGSPYYVSPEVLEQKYNQKCDLWSCGVILYTLLSGSPPFKGRTQQEIFDNILKASPSYEERVWPRVSPDARNLLKQLLQRNPFKRISAQQALEHKWIADSGSTIPIEENVLAGIEHFHFRTKFLAIVETYLAVNTVSQEDRRLLAEKFKEIDKDDSGTIDEKELLQGFRQVYGSMYTEQAIHEIVSNIDTNGSGKIDFTEFIVVITERQKLFQRNALEGAFKFFDKDSTGYIEIEQLKELLGNSSDEEVLLVMNSLDADKDRRISKAEFVDRLMEKEGLTT